jgi:hypothetical protein
MGVCAMRDFHTEKEDERSFFRQWVSSSFLNPLKTKILLLSNSGTDVESGW